MDGGTLTAGTKHAAQMGPLSTLDEPVLPMDFDPVVMFSEDVLFNSQTSMDADFERWLQDNLDLGPLDQETHSANGLSSSGSDPASSLDGNARALRASDSNNSTNGGVRTAPDSTARPQRSATDSETSGDHVTDSSGGASGLMSGLNNGIGSWSMTAGTAPGLNGMGLTSVAQAAAQPQKQQLWPQPLPDPSWPQPRADPLLQLKQQWQQEPWQQAQQQAQQPQQQQQEAQQQPQQVPAVSATATSAHSGDMDEVPSISEAAFTTFQFQPLAAMQSWLASQPGGANLTLPAGFVFGAGAAATAAPQPAAAPKSGAAAKGAPAQPPAKPKRFRERQKEQISALEAEVAEKMAQLHLLSAENEILKLRTSILESAVAGREMQMKVLTEFGPPVFNPTDPNVNISEALAATGDRPPPPEECGGGSQCTPAQEKKCVQKIKHMSAQEVRRCWKEFLQAISREMLAVQAAGSAGVAAIDPGVIDRITRLVKRNLFLCKHVILLNPGTLYAMQAVNLETNQTQAASEEHWRGVVAQLELSSKQVQDLMGAYELYSNSLQKVLGERDELRVRLLGADHGKDECKRQLRGDDGTMSQLESLEALAGNLKKEHTMRLMLNCFWYARTLNTLQFAKAAMYSYPHFPDVHAMVSVIVEDAARLAPNGRRPLVFGAHPLPAVPLPAGLMA